MMHLAFVVIGFFLTGLKSLDFLYHFQIKEYRLDRFIAMVKERGPEVLFTIGKLPARSWRNILVSLITGILLLLWSAASFANNVLLVVTAVFYWFIAFAAVFAGILITRLPSLLKKNLLVLTASTKLKRSQATVIGITGSYGKTTTKEYLADILSQKYQVAKTPHNMNTTVGVAMAILNRVTPGTEYFIAEMGAYKPGEIAEICRMAPPRYGIITAIGNQHLDLFGSRERLLLAKKELLTSLPADGQAFVNADRAPVDKLRSGIRSPIVPYRQQDKSVNIRSYHLPPEIIREDLIPCILLARALGLTEKEIRSGIMAIKSNRQRLTPHTGKAGTTIIDNSYNTNQEGFIFSLNLLDGRKEKMRILVSPGIIELGKEKRQAYGRILHVLAKTGVFLFTTDADFKLPENKNVRFFANERDMANEILAKLGPQTVILFEGRMNRDFINSLMKK